MSEAEGDTWLRERLGSPAEDLYLTALFSRPHTRLAVSAIAALFIELEAIATGFNDLNVARTKLAWWREELARLEAKRPQHPLTRTLARAGTPVPVMPLADVVTGTELILLEGPVTDLATARMRAERGFAPLAVVFAAALDPDGATPARYAGLGEAAGLARTLTESLPPDAAASVARAARAMLLDQAGLMRDAPQPLRVLAALAWRRTRLGSPGSGRGEAIARVVTAWRAARGHLPRTFARA